MVTGIVMASPLLGKALAVASAQRTQITESAVNPYWGPPGSECSEEEEEIGPDRSSIHQTEAKSSGREMGEGDEWEKKMGFQEFSKVLPHIVSSNFN